MMKLKKESIEKKIEIKKKKNIEFKNSSRNKKSNH